MLRGCSKLQRRFWENMHRGLRARQSPLRMCFLTIQNTQLRSRSSDLPLFLSQVWLHRPPEEALGSLFKRNIVSIRFSP